MTDISLTVGDTLPPVEATLLDPTGSPVNLTGAEVHFLLYNSASGEKVVESLASINDAEGGKVTYSWSSEDTEDSGYFDGKFRVKFGSNTNNPDIQHYPDEGSVKVEIDDK